MTLPVSLPRPAPARRPRPSRPVGLLVLTAFALAALTAVTPHAAGLALLAAATLVLGVAAAFAMRAHWQAALEPAPAADAVPAPGPGADRPVDDDLTAQLRRLHTAHVEKVNVALDAGREDLAHELADSYTDQALLLLVRG